MAKTIEQLAEQANIIETAVRQGENTAERVGGLFTDMVDYLSTLKLSDIKLGPLLTSLNDPRLVNPEDGQTLSFSVMKEGWTFDDALTELRVSDRRIENLVTTNYNQFLQTKEEFEQDMYAITQDLNQKYADFTSYRVQTDQYIDQWCVAYDEQGNKVAVSRIWQTCEEIEQTVTDNWNAYLAEKDRLENTIFGYTDEQGTFHAGILKHLNDVIDESASSASWISQNKNQISAVVANFDSEGKPTAASGLVTTATYSGLFTTYMNSNGVVTSGNISTYLTDYVDADGVRQIISVAEIGADKIKFNMTFDWTVNNSQNQTIFKLDSNGNLTVAGNIKGGQIIDDVTVGTSGQKMRIYVDENNGNLIRSGLRGTDPTMGTMLDLGFESANAVVYPTLLMSYGSTQSAASMPSSYFMPGRIVLKASSTGNQVRLGIQNGRLDFYSYAYLSYDAAEIGQVYMDGDRFLKVK